MAIDAGADAIGLVGEMPSGPGVIDEGQIRQIAASTPPGVSSFLLTSRTRAADISDHLQATRPSTVQMVDAVDPAEIEALAERHPETRRVQVVHVEDDSALDVIPEIAPYIHAFLLDSGRPSATTPEFGGTGRTHDWSISRRFVAASPKPVFLAGGLNPSNVAEAISQVQPFGIDVCSGLRTDNRLFTDKLSAFMRAAVGV